MPDYVPEKFEPIKNIEFEAEQNWFGKTIDKIKVEFADEEDLMLLILNIFVHDFGHDYNFLGDSYLRRIVSNIKELELLGIENGNKILKKLTDIISSEPRVPFMYNDNIFVDTDDPEYFSEELKNKKQKFYERLNGFENLTQKHKILKEVGQELDEKYAEQQMLAEEVKKGFLTKEQIEKEKMGKLEGGRIKLEDPPLLRTESLEYEDKKPKEVIEEQGELGEVEEPKGEEKVKEESLDIPSLSPLTVDISGYIKDRANDPDSLAMLSTLKLYITSYLGPNYYTNLIPESVDPKTEAFYKYYMHYSVITTFYGLICHYDDIVEEKLVDERLRNLTSMFSDLLLILLASYLEFVNRAGENYFSREDALDPLSILDSNQVMNNYNRIFAEYVQSTNAEFEDFKSGLLSQFEIVEDVDEVKLGGADGDAIEDKEKPKYKFTYVKRKYGVFHNNLLTTVARGIFLKTGIWQQIYPPEPGDKAVNFPSQFNYNKDLEKSFSQQFEDWKTGELSLITKITTELLKSRGFKNDLLIAEILILKHMLIEILPDFLYLANGIDDKLRNFLEVYLYKCGNYDADLKDLTVEDQSIIAMATEEEAKAEDLKFIVGDDDEAEISGGSIMRGGVNFAEKSDFNYEDSKFGFSKGDRVDIIPDAISNVIVAKSPEEKKREKMLLSREDVERAYKLNMDVIRNLTESGIPPIELDGGKIVTNMFELLKMNAGMVQRIGSKFAFPAPKKRFILDNASKLNRNVNGLKLFHETDALEKLKDEPDYEELLKKFRMAQKFFGLYKTLKRGVVCAGSSMLDAMDNCSLEKGATEPKEVGTTNFEFVFDDPASGKHLSYGGVVLFYKGKNATTGEENINVHIDFSLKTKLSGSEPDDVAHVVVDELDVADSEDLKARVVYKSIIKEVNDLFKCAFKFEETTIPEGDELTLDPALKAEIRQRSIKKMRALWSFLQFNPYSQTNNAFNRLLGKTGVKNLGDLLQETQGTIKWGGYVNTTEGMDDDVKAFIASKNINIAEDIIWRSVSKRDAIIPYDENGDALRLAVEGDRPSAFRAIYFVLFARIINSMTIAGYLQLTRSILVSRNEPFIRVEPPPVPPPLIGTVSLEEKDFSRPQSPIQEEPLLPETKKTLDTLVLEPCPIPYGKVIYVNSEAKNINVKAVEIKDPKINNPKTVEELEKKLKIAVKTKLTKSKTATPPLNVEEIETEKLKIISDLEDLVNQLNYGSSIPKFSELKTIECERTASRERTDNLIGIASLGVGLGGRTRKHKKPLKKNTNTRNKNKTKPKKTKRSKKTIKRRKAVQRKHKKTR
jgi:hypothetical protein